MSEGKSKVFPINVGPMTSLSSLVLYAGRPLQDFSRECMTGAAPLVEWDLRNLEPRKPSMPCLTTFLSLADRMRRFTRHRSVARLRWDPDLFGFWEAVDFLRVATDCDLLDWTPPGVLGGFRVPSIHPDTKIVAFKYPNDLPADIEGPEWEAWKAQQRQEHKARLESWSGQLFRPTRNAGSSDRGFADQIAMTTAELITNAQMWGRATAFVGLQRAAGRVTIAVSDCGIGLLRSLREKAGTSVPNLATDDLEAIILASVLNPTFWGLRRAIETIVKRKGWVTISSGDAEVNWRSGSWDLVRLSNFSDENGRTMIREASARLPAWQPGWSPRQPGEGYHRRYKVGLRGVRIAFEVPFRPERE